MNQSRIAKDAIRNLLEIENLEENVVIINQVLALLVLQYLLVIE